MVFKHINLQFFGSRGASGGGDTGGGGRGGGTDVKNTESLLSAGAAKQQEINETMNAVKAIADRYGLNMNDIQLATVGARSAGVMAYYDSQGNLAINKNYFTSEGMNKSYDNCVKNGYHPSRGDKPGLTAVAAHELGHALNHKVAGSWENLDKEANKIVKEASKKAGYKSVKDFRKAISGYASKNSAEAIAEAFSDVYCNGSKASKE